jgi:hypothetical protein
LPRLDVVIAWVCVGFGFVAAAAIDVLFPLDGILLAADFCLHASPRQTR